MADLFENPAGLDGFEFIEFSAPEKGVLEPVFESMGFTKIARHRSKDVELWRQGGINFITNYEPALSRLVLFPGARAKRVRQGIPRPQCQQSL